ncbi:hypothetical protein [Mycobacterium aquaticum]|uniref:Uncharacterized protein n=1 Tax=Mycobacterium aquaticum TaxID=1927124 RepID=A0A1X0ABF2_9MYCO|nr:hypothetical protein [Mycobacterium aquaticum]ORA27393.1 hypothetical protein BST13_30515 [Mycobacterium aquaticum]
MNEEGRAEARRQFDAIQWPKGAAALYRRAARELAREQGQDSAGVVAAGTAAEYLYRWRVGEHHVDSPGELHLEVLHTDALAACAAETVGTARSLQIVEWISQLGVVMTERVQRWLLEPPLDTDTPLEAAYRSVATEKVVLTADCHRVALGVVAGAAAVARLRRHNRSDVEGSTEDQIVEMACSDPLLAVAWGELDETQRRGPGSWVVSQWNEISEAAEELAALTAAVNAPATVEQRIAIARHEVTHGLLWRARDTEDEGLQQGYRSISVYGEALAEGLARWEDADGSPEGAQEAMRLHADAAADAAGVMLSDDSRNALLNAVHERWPQLAPPLPRN